MDKIVQTLKHPIAIYPNYHNTDNTQHNVTTELDQIMSLESGLAFQFDKPPQVNITGIIFLIAQHIRFSQIVF